MTSTKGKLTEDDWRAVFKIRCKSKQGNPITPDEFALTSRAWDQDPERYTAMGESVFNATIPFGSNVRWRRD